MVQLLCNFNPPKTLYYYLCVAVYTIGNEQGPDGHILCRRLFVRAIDTGRVPRRPLKRPSAHDCRRHRDSCADCHRHPRDVWNLVFSP
jgi:hypothetical protein